MTWRQAVGWWMLAIMAGALFGALLAVTDQPLIVIGIVFGGCALAGWTVVATKLATGYR